VAPVDHDWQTILRDAGQAVEGKRVAAVSKDLARYREIIGAVAAAGGAPAPAQVRELVSLAEALRLPSDALEGDVRACLNFAGNQRLLAAKRAEAEAAASAAELAVVERENLQRRLKEIETTIHQANHLPRVCADVARAMNEAPLDNPRMFGDLQTEAERLVSR
jgi:hypothetical protein